MKSQELSEFFSLIGQAKKEKEEEFDNLLKEANVDLDSMATSLFTGIENAKVEVKEQKKKEEKLIESLDSLLVSLDKPKETTPVVVGVPEDFDISSLEEEVEESPIIGEDTTNYDEWIEEEVVEEETVEEDDTISKAIKFIDTQLKEELKDIEPNDPTVDSIKAEVKELRNILYKVLAHGPGSGEVRVLKMDDVDTDDLADGRVLSYDSSSEKLKFVDQSGGAGYANTAGISTYAITAGIATNSTQLNGQAASYYLDYDNFTNTPTIPTNNNQLTNGAGFITNSVTGNFTVSGNVSIGGTLTYEDVTNIDSVGLITARNGIVVGSGITLSKDGDIFATGITSSTKVHVGVDTGVYGEDLVVTGDARVTGILTIGTGSIVLDPTAKQLRGLQEIVIGIANTITIKQDDKGEIEFTDAAGAPKSVGIGTTVSVNTSGIITASSFVGGFTGDLTGNADTATNATNSTQLNSRAASHYSDYNNFTNTPTIPTNNNQLTNGAGYLTASTLLTDGAFSSATATTTTTSQTAVDTFAAATYRSVKYQIQITRGSEYHITEVFIVHDGTTSYGTEYATIKTGSSLASFDTDIDSGNVRLLATPTSSSSTVFKLVRTLIKV